jgi:hypothetical protein
MYERRLSELHASLRSAASGPEFVPSGHFYSAIPDRNELEKRLPPILRRDPLDVPGLDLHIDAQLCLLCELEPLYASQPFSGEETPDLRYRFENGAFSYADGLFLHLLLRHFKPSTIVEVGSGWSSACTLDTIEQFLEGKTQCTFIEPYDGLLRSLLKPNDLSRVRIIAQPVQDVSINKLVQLQENDLLFIDSTHVSKVGSDVNYLFFEVLPRLKPGVLVHVHDVFPSFEYPAEWHREGRVWTEDYLLRAFLLFNSAFEVLLWPSLLARVAPERLFGPFPLARANPGGSIYLRRTRAGQ